LDIYIYIYMYLNIIIIIICEWYINLFIPISYLVCKEETNPRRYKVEKNKNGVMRKYIFQR